MQIQFLILFTDHCAYSPKSPREPTVYNLGHAYRKSRRYEDAERCFLKCVSLLPSKSSTWSALAFTKHMQLDYDGAIEGYHQALSCKPDDPFSSEMLNRALRDAMNEGLHIEDVNHDIEHVEVSLIGTPKVGTRGGTPAWSFSSSRTTPGSNMNESSMMSADMDSDVDMT